MSHVKKGFCISVAQISRRFQVLCVAAGLSLVLVLSTLAIKALAQDATSPPQSESSSVSAPTSTIKGRTVFETIKRGGPLMIPIFLCSLVGLAFAMERAVNLRRGRIIPRSLVENIKKTIEENGTEKGFEITRRNSSPLSRIASAGMSRRNGSRLEMEKAIEDAGGRELWNLRKNARPLGIIATIAPLLGLLGTVWGMIQAFDVVASEGALGKPELLADGIAQALLTTLFGLGVAILSLIFYHYFRGKADGMMHEIEEIMGEMVDAFAMPTVGEAVPAASDSVTENLQTSGKRG